jgi:hypothetical protein
MRLTAAERVGVRQHGNLFKLPPRQHEVREGVERLVKAVKVFYPSPEDQDRFRSLCREAIAIDS